MRYYQKRMKLFIIISVLLIPLKINANENNAILFSYSSPQHQVAQIGQQLYRALQQQQWKKAEELLLDYQQLPLHETLLINYAKALLAQIKGDFLNAEFYYQQQLKQKVDFIPAQTGLIQLYFHLREYKKAQRQLNQLSNMIDLPKDIIQSIAFYRAKLASYFQGQRFYQLSFFYDDNINHAPDLAEKIVSQSTQRKMTLRGAKPIVSTGLAHYFSFYQPFILYSHHTFSSYTYARYIDYHSYRSANFLALYTQLGYRYQKPQYQWSITPYYEIKKTPTQYEYQAWGSETQFSYLINKKQTINLSLDYKIKKYQETLKNLNTQRLSYSTNHNYYLNNRVNLVNQLNYQLGRKKNTLLNYQLYGIKTGVYYPLSVNWHMSLFLQYQFKQFNNYNPLLKKRRKDNSFIFTTNIKNKSPFILGFYPAIELRYTRRLSNVDWLYQYQQHEVLFKLEKQF
ncbi:surface lipoprotein assembly modifier [Proteus cibi]|uniref:Surface lipoprotein assembly modifier n=1 Tax=Proteus cibi TaxID=2050966 RepID=A0ABU6EJ17_9GAMM|nr:surface lipoprotein assembly modifier [Proteus cibi]MEB6858673.1 surface lipoprotein assembly modifier [Proteus cibi]MEB7090252.1 surface lipoprotein assembly modifier [Proteus cibi]